MAAAIAIGLLGGCVNWPFDLGRVFSFFPFFAFGVLFAEPFRSWQKRWYAWGPLAAAIVVFYTVTVQRIVTAETRCMREPASSSPTPMRRAAT